MDVKEVRKYALTAHALHIFFLKNLTTDAYGQIDSGVKIEIYQRLIPSRGNLPRSDTESLSVGALSKLLRKSAIYTV